MDIKPNTKLTDKPKPATTADVHMQYHKMLEKYLCTKDALKHNYDDCNCKCCCCTIYRRTGEYHVHR
jgi:hypothetical protein